MAATTVETRSAPARGWVVPLIVGSAGFMQAFDGNAVAIALPAMATGFGVPALALGIVITAYLVGAAACLPLCGWAAERFGARRLFLAAIAAFALTSLGCGVASGLPMLVLARFAQGCAGAMLLPVGRMIVLADTPKAGMLRAMGLLTTPIMLGPLLAPPIGGLIVSIASWRWLFYVNIPIAAIGLLLVRRYVPDILTRDPRPLDILGAILLPAALIGLTCGVGFAVRPESLGVGLALTVAGIAGAGAYALHAGRHPHPIVSARLFAVRSFAVGTIGGFFPRLLVSAMPFLLALLFQVGFGLSPVAAGALLVASALGSLPARWVVTGLVRRFSLRGVLIGNAVLVAASVGACATLTAQTPHALILALLFAQGLLRSLQLVSLMALNFIDVEPAEVATASTIASLGQQIAMSLGIAVVVPAVEIARRLTEGGAFDAAAIRPAFVVLALLSLLSIGWFVRLPRDGGAAVGAAAVLEAEELA